jgi:hypothetical protein
VRRVSGVRYFSVSADPPYPTTAPTGFRGVITLSFGADDRVTDPAAPELVVAKNSGAGWESIDRSANTATTLTSGEFTSFSLFALASIDPIVANNPLPITLTHFAAERSIGGVRLTWATASEKNSARFEVERSVDGKAFERIGTVAAAGRAHAYELADRQLPATAVLYYRLRQVDLDGTASYSPVRTVTTTTTAAALAASLTVYPTQAVAGQPLRYATTGPALAADATLEVYDATGRCLRRQAAGPATGVLAVEGLASGWYWVRLRTASGSQQARFYQP